MRLDCLVKNWLRDRGIVDLAVPVATVANHIDDDVGAESVAILQRHAANPHDGVHVLGIHVEDGDRLAPCQVRGKALRVFFAIAGGEAHQVVHDDMQGAPRGIAGQVRIVHGLGGNALSGKGRVAVHEQRKKFFASTFPGAVLLGACASDGDRINSFEMAGIRNQVDIDLGATARDVLAGRPQMVLHIA